MKLYQKVKKCMQKQLKGVRIMALSSLAIPAAMYVLGNLLPNNLDGKILPYEFGGLPFPFMTRIVEVNGDGIPDGTLFYAIGPGGFFNGQERKPTQREINWYQSQ